MAASRVPIQVTWSSAASVTLSSATSVLSDPIAFNVNDVLADIEVLADNQGTPAAGDVVNCFVAYTVGDLDTGGDDYATTKHAERIAQIDTTLEDPAAVVRPLRVASKALKLVTDAPQAATRNIVVKATVSVYRTA